ncbi:hypothetical protein [uncultured Maritimibacter sp.]|jgi:hypothetical protein|uniref:hypothetical protein n=1 Tax=uncultured Maritimibacter sp. TaxID=991866 RepID=UPI000A60991E|nr:hypothetical protein [uncultured Maritimibacter sp.]
MDDYRQPDTWALERGDTLSNHDWFPLHGHRLLSSAFVAKCVMLDRREDLGTALILWAEAMRQDPAGTLPCEPIQLAALARFHSLEAWEAVADNVLHGFELVHVKDPRTGELVPRMGHALLGEIATEMHKRKTGRDAAREQARGQKRKDRIKAKMKEAGIEAGMIENPRVIGELLRFFDASPDLYITADHVVMAMRETMGFTGTVSHFPGARA